MDRDSEEPDDDTAILGEEFRPTIWHRGVVVVLAVILCIIIGGVRPLLYFLFPLAVLAVQYPILYLILVALSFVISTIGVLKSDENNNTNLFYGSALLFWLSIIGGLLYFVLPTIYWLLMMD